MIVPYGTEKDKGRWYQLSYPEDHMDATASLFLEGKVSRAYLKLSLPLVASMVVTLIYNLADTFFVAQTNNTALVSGVSLGAPIFTFLMALGNIFGQGGSSLVSRMLGQGDRNGVKAASSFCFWITILLGALIAALMLAFMEPLLRILGASDETRGYARDYFIPLAAGAPFVMLSFIHSNLLRSEGLSKESMAGTILGTLVNIILDPLMISTMGMGARGAAIATVIGYIASDAFFATRPDTPHRHTRGYLEHDAELHRDNEQPEAPSIWQREDSGHGHSAQGKHDRPSDHHGIRLWRPAYLRLLLRAGQPGKDEGALPLHPGIHRARRIDPFACGLHRSARPHVALHG